MSAGDPDYLIRFLQKMSFNKGCWIWTAATDPGNHYGKFRFKLPHMECAHRVSWQLFRGPIPKGKKILHRCDNPSCVKPSHLFIGTQKDNVRDCMRKNRRSKMCGEDWPTSKLKWKDVLFIRSSNLNYSELGQRFNVYPNAIKGIKLGLCWKWKDGEHRNGNG